VGELGELLARGTSCVYRFNINWLVGKIGGETFEVYSGEFSITLDLLRSVRLGMSK